MPLINDIAAGLIPQEGEVFVDPLHIIKAIWACSELNECIEASANPETDRFFYGSTEDVVSFCQCNGYDYYVNLEDFGGDVDISTGDGTVYDHDVAILIHGRARGEVTAMGKLLDCEIRKYARKQTMVGGCRLMCVFPGPYRTFGPTGRGKHIHRRQYGFKIWEPKVCSCPTLCD